ncbi:MAG: response regulator [Gemmatimonadetes bacterium]|nr:response regulator [Gemmatimonadota bacterium]
MITHRALVAQRALIAHRALIADRAFLTPYLQKIIEASEDQGWIGAVTAEGEPRYLQFHNVVVTGDDGSKFVLGHAQDVTALVESDNELRAARDHLDRVLAASPAVTYSSEAKPDYLTTYISPNVVQQTGYSQDDFKRRGFWIDKIHPDDRADVLEGLKRLLEFGDSRHEYRFLHADGDYRWMVGEQRLVRNDLGDPIAIAGQWIDRTESKRLTDDVDRFFRVSLDLLCIRSTDGFFKRINPAFGEVLGYPDQELLDRPIRDFMHPDDVEPTDQLLASLGSGGTKVSFDDRWRCSDGSYRTFSWSAIASEVDGLVYAVARDVTQSLLRAEELRRAKKMADEASRAKSEFLANMSHEIRTPMNGVIGMTELTLETNLTDQQREYLQMVHASAGALLDTINSILDFSKIEAGKMELEQIDFTLWETVTGALKPLALRARNKGVELLYDEGPDVPERLRGDPGRLRQALVNLAGNAVKFTQAGSVRLTVHRADSEGDEVRLRFDVKDTGIGIPADKLDHIFLSFNQVDGSMSRRFGGTGLGLAITSGIVKMMGGQVSVTSDPGAGSTFSFTAAFDRAIETHPAARPKGDLRGLKVLTVDDHAANRVILVEFAKRMGMEVVSAASGAEALDALDAAYRNGTAIDLALLDCHMPEMGGFQLAEKIRNDARFRDLVLIALTAAGQPGDGARCEELGIASYLLKPLAPSELRDAILLTLENAPKAKEKGRLVTRHSLREARLSLNILLAEDNRVNQALAIHMLERFGHRVHLATNGREVLEVLEKEPFDVILMDIQMPEMDGLEATAKIREREAKDGTFIPIVAMTAHAMVGDRDRFLDAGMNDYVSKPINRDRLQEVLRGIGRTQPPPEVAPPEDAIAEADKAERSYDRAILMERMDHDMDLIRALVDVFASDRDKLLGELEGALDGGDAEALERAAHTIKGALGVFGAEPARARAERLEHIGRDGSIEDGRAQYPELRHAVLTLESDLRDLVVELDR